MSSGRSHNKRSNFLGSCGSDVTARSYDLLASTDFIIVSMLFHRVEMHCFSVVSSFRFTFVCFASVTSSLHVAITAATSSGKLYSGLSPEEGCRAWDRTRFQLWPAQPIQVSSRNASFMLAALSATKTFPSFCRPNSDNISATKFLMSQLCVLCTIRLKTNVPVPVDDVIRELVEMLSSRAMTSWIRLPLTSSFLLEYSSEYLNEYLSTR